MEQSIIAVVFIIVVSIMCACSFSKKRNATDELITRDSSSALKGVAILYVFVHHYWQLTSDFYNSHTFVGYIGVTIFFLISGYVSQTQLFLQGKKSLNYRFFIKKFVRLYIPYIIIKIIIAVVKGMSLHNIVASVIHIEDDWFLCAITLLYILFFITSKLTRNRQICLAMLIGICLYTGVCVAAGLPFVWFNTTFAFYIGLIMAEKKNQQILNLKIIKIASGILTIALGILTVTRWFLPAIISTMFSITLAVMILCFLYSYDIKNNILKWIGNISWEFYLFQSSVLVIIGGYIGDKYFTYLLAALAISVLAGFLINKLVTIPQALIKQRIKK